MLSAIYVTALFENLLFLAPVLLLLLMPVGFIASCWVTNTVVDLFRKDREEEISNTERLGTLIILSVLFGTYCYIVFRIAH